MAPRQEFDWLTLDEGEEVVWSGKPHRYSLVPALVVGVPLVILLVGIVVIAAAYLRRENTQFVVTTDGIYRKTGVFSRDVQRIDFDKVQNISYSQDFLGTRFGYGTVTVETAGGKDLLFYRIEDPQAVRRLVDRVVGQQGEIPGGLRSGKPSERRSGGSGRPSNHGDDCYRRGWTAWVSGLLAVRKARGFATTGRATSQYPRARGRDRREASGKTSGERSGPRVDDES